MVHLIRQCCVGHTGLAGRRPYTGSPQSTVVPYVIPPKTEWGEEREVWDEEETVGNLLPLLLTAFFLAFLTGCQPGFNRLYDRWRKLGRGANTPG
jgi:hypothetical protein